MHCLKYFTWQDEGDLFRLGCVEQELEVWHETSPAWIVFPFLPLAGHFLLCFLPSVSVWGHS